MAKQDRQRPLLVTGFMAALMASALAAADVRVTPHNLGQRAAAGAPVDAREVCVYCHTPNETPRLDEAPRQEQKRVVPKWQRALPADYSYTIYDDIGRLGLAGSTAVGSQSVACLSCHDANQAFSAARLTFDHPFGVPYRGLPRRLPAQQRRGDGEQPSQAAKRASGVVGFRQAVSGVMDNRTVWWVPTSGNRTQRGRSDIPLYSRREASAEEVAYIECGSCHDPHSSNKLFLRVPNEGSRLCLSCHDA